MLSIIKEQLQEYIPSIIGVKQSYAVLLPLIEVNGKLHILYEVRASHISQPGDVAFPGGKIEPGETSAEAALRETKEELGIPANNIQLLGEMDQIISGSHLIQCFVGKISLTEEQDYTLNEEVARIFTQPLHYFQTHPPQYHELVMAPTLEDDFPYHLIQGGKDYSFRKHTRRIPFYQLDEHQTVLWGFTAELTQRFIELVT